MRRVLVFLNIHALANIYVRSLDGLTIARLSELNFSSSSVSQLIQLRVSAVASLVAV